jgi:hypothetical protein
VVVGPDVVTGAGVVVGPEVVKGAVVVVGPELVVGAGEAAAWAGTITDLTTGRIQRSGKASVPNVLTPNAICKIRRRSTVMEPAPNAACARLPETFVTAQLGARKIPMAHVPAAKLSSPQVSAAEPSIFSVLQKLA